MPYLTASLLHLESGEQGAFTAIPGGTVFPFPFLRSFVPPVLRLSFTAYLFSRRNKVEALGIAIVQT